MPTGAYVKYEYYGGSTSHNAADDYITARKVSETGNSADEKTWSYSRAVNGSTRTVTVTSPEGDVVVHTFNDNGVETATAWKNSAGTTLKSESRTWTQGTAQSNSQPTNPRTTSVVTTLDGGMQSTATRTLTNGFVTEVTQTGYGTSTVVAKKTMTYTTINATVQRNVISTETFYGIDPISNTLVVQGKKEYFYDQFTLTNRGTSVPNHTHNTSESNRGNLTKLRTYKDATNYIEEQTKYDNLGNVVETIDPLNHSTTVDFTDNFTDSTNRYTFSYPKTVTNALSQSFTSKYDFNTGLVKEITNLRGNTTTTAYDLLNRVTTITEPAVSSVSKVTTYTYDDTNRITTKEVTVDSSGNKGHVETYFDKLYRTVKTITNDPEGNMTAEMVYDTAGRVKKSSNPYRSGESILWTESTFDALNRPVAVTAPDNSTIVHSYSNNVATTTDQSGSQRRFTYDVLGQLVQVDEANPTLATPSTTTYKYYGIGPLYQSNQSNQTRTWVYNWLGQMTSQTLPESGTTTFTYNAAGLLVTKTDARNIVTTLAYDNINRPTQQSFSDSTPTVSFIYDQNSYTGQRTTMTDGLGSVTYAFDTRDRLTQESRTLTGVSGTFSTSYVYNVKGDVTQMTYPSGRVVNFAYATGGGCCNSRLSSVSDGTTNTTLLNGITFNAAGGVLTQTLNPGNYAVNQTLSYNNRLQQTQILAALASSTLMHFGYDYGSASQNTGRVLSRTDNVQPEHSANYVYDTNYRLHQAANPSANWGMAWTFDVWSNRLTQTPQGLATSKVGSPQVAYTNNRNQSHTYDAAGNTTNDTVHSYAYNAENQQISMDGGAATYAYDGEGRRLKKTTSSETTYSFYGSGGILCEFSTASGGGLSSATAAASTDKTLFRTSERTSTAVLFFNTYGIVLENNRTLPYGEAWLSDVASANDKKFTTYDRDKESGLDYAMARHYSHNSGRFVSADPLLASASADNPISWNRYIYALGDPVNLTDPTGLVACGDLTIYGTGSNFDGATVNQIMQSTTSGEALMAQWMWLETGTLRNEDVNNMGGYAQDLVGLGTAILNMWDVDNDRIRIFDAKGNAHWPIGRPSKRDLRGVILDPDYSKDIFGRLFNDEGKMRGVYRNRLDAILRTDTLTGPLLPDLTGNLRNADCIGVVYSILVAGNLLSGQTQRWRPGGRTILFWDEDDPNNAKNYFRRQGYTGEFSSPSRTRERHTFWSPGGMSYSFGGRVIDRGPIRIPAPQP